MSDSSVDNLYPYPLCTLFIPSPTPPPALISHGVNPVTQGLSCLQGLVTDLGDHKSWCINIWTQTNDQRSLSME
ncbi:hypothetical protein PoB_003494600 [Plakobranchus ocellatus]|uniref:Uncharacterized protein n=1 Tax=Plakobranchus ocellatus TaxID=259542 RepID=A0AAV4ABC4_9GAST|nr:hypothetical protein PoB_003494600 [Plakobranchus ocellatus]